MNCHDAAERLFEAAPAELLGAADSPLGRHLAACEACRARADAVLAGQDRLERGLAGVRPGRSPEAAIRSARSAARRSARSGRPGPREARGSERPGRPEPRPREERRRPRGRRPGSWVRLGVPLAAAAAAAAVLLSDRRGTLDRDAPPSGGPRLAHAKPAGVAPESDRPYAVFETDDPDISVIWFFEPEGETP